MVKIIEAHECNHVSCDGELEAAADYRTGELLYGGYFCLCKCHDDERRRKSMENAYTGEDW